MMRTFELRETGEVTFEGVCFTDGMIALRGVRPFPVMTLLYANMALLLEGRGITLEQIYWYWTDEEKVSEQEFEEGVSGREVLFKNFKELWKDLTAFMKEHPHYDYSCRDNSGQRRFGWAAHENPGDALPAKVWTIQASDMWTTALETELRRSYRDRMKFLEEAVKAVHATMDRPSWHTRLDSL